MTLSVMLASLWASVSPTQRITLRPQESALATFLPTTSLLSPHSARRSLCPRMTQPRPRSASCSAATSPVYAPGPLTQQFCPATP